MPFIRAYTKADGTVIREHSRLPAGARRQTSIAFWIVAAVVVFANSGTAATGSPGVDRLPTPRSSTASYPNKGPGADRPAPRSTPPVKYPIKWPGWKESAPRPRPTVSYPIKWPGWKEPAPRPRPTVSYPIKWERNGDGR